MKDVAKTSCFLSWTKPEHDGGAKIDGYIIEMLKSGTTDWIRVAENVPTVEFFLKGLMEKQEYSFRVRAVNVAGESEPSEPSDPVLCKERLSKSRDLRPRSSIMTSVTLWSKVWCGGVGIPEVQMREAAMEVSIDIFS